MSDQVGQAIMWTYYLAAVSVLPLGWWVIRNEMQKFKNSERDQNEQAQPLVDRAPRAVGLRLRANRQPPAWTGHPGGLPGLGTLPGPHTDARAHGEPNANAHRDAKPDALAFGDPDAGCFTYECWP